MGDKNFQNSFSEVFSFDAIRPNIYAPLRRYVVLTLYSGFPYPPNVINVNGTRHAIIYEKGKFFTDNKVWRTS